MADELIQLHVTAVTRLSRAAIPGMLQRKARGVFTQCRNGGLQGTGVRAMVLCSGIVATEFHTVSADDVAQATLRGFDAGEVVCVPGLEDGERKF
jgi:short-subunit dehydrogenase